MGVLNYRGNQSMNSKVGDGICTHTRDVLNTFDRPEKYIANA